MTPWAAVRASRMSTWRAISHGETRRVFATEDAREAVTAGLQKLIDLGYD